MRCTFDGNSFTVFSSLATHAAAPGSRACWINVNSVDGCPVFASMSLSSIGACFFHVHKCYIWCSSLIWTVWHR